MNPPTDHCCEDCPQRCVGCHGQTPDGAWKCEKWARHMEETEQRRRDMERNAMLTEYARRAVQRGLRIKRKGR